MAASLVIMEGLEKILENPTKLTDLWNEISSGKGRHSMTLGTIKDNAEVLYEENIRKGYKFNFSDATVSHKFKYKCKQGETIQAVVAYDCWDDDTGGTPELISGGVGYDEVVIKVTSRFVRGFHFKFYVYGTK